MLARPGAMTVLIGCGSRHWRRRAVSHQTKPPDRHDSRYNPQQLDYIYNGLITSAQAAGHWQPPPTGDQQVGAVVTVNGPPTSGPNQTTGYFEAIITEPQGTSFMGLISHQNTVTVGSRAVAGAPTASQACIYIASPSGKDVFHLQGNTTITAPGFGIYVNSKRSLRCTQSTGNSLQVTPHTRSAQLILR